MSTMHKVGGGAKASYFAVEITAPWIDRDRSETLTFLCDAVQLPGTTIATDDNYRPHGYGPAQNMPWGVMHPDIQLNFIGDNSGVIQGVLQEWCNRVIPHNYDRPMADTNDDGLYNYLVNYPEDYRAVVSIHTYDAKAGKIVTYTLSNAFPAGMPTISMTANDAGYVRVPITIHYTTFQYGYRTTMAGGGSIQPRRAGGFISAITDASGGIGSQLRTGVSGVLGGGLLGQFVGRVAENQFERQRQRVLGRVSTGINDILNDIQLQVPPQLQDVYSQAIPLLGGLTDFND